MNIIRDGLYADENPSLLTKTKKVVKMAIKGTAYTAFLGIAVASMLHLYNNPEDRKAVGNGLSSIGNGVKAKVNDIYFKSTGHTLSEHVSKTSNVVEGAGNNVLKSFKENAPTKEDGEKIIQKTEVASKMIANDVKQHTPGITETIKEDAKGSATKAREDVNHKIKQIREYSGDLTERLAKQIKP